MLPFIFISIKNASCHLGKYSADTNYTTDIKCIYKLYIYQVPYNLWQIKPPLKTVNCQNIKTRKVANLKYHLVLKQFLTDIIFSIFLHCITDTVTKKV